MTTEGLSLTTPPQGFKRQRSGESQRENGRPASLVLGGPEASPPPATEVKIPAYLNKTRAEIMALFQELEWKQRFRLSHAINNPEDSPFRVDRSPAVINRNRYNNVQPWDASRVKLKTLIGGSDYVNASPISLHSRRIPDTKSEDGGASAPTSSEFKYIATQGPKEGQFAHFWHMVMQETVGPVGVILMLTQCYEGSKEKCSQYFPRDWDNPVVPLPLHEDGEEPAEIGDPFLDPNPISTDADDGGADSNDPEIDAGAANGASEPPRDSVTLVEVTYDAATACEVRRMQLEINGERKEILHYLFTGWPDFGRPEGGALTALLELLRQSAARAGGPNHPRFVHCSAGVGRTGTFIALDYLLTELEKGVLIASPNVDSRTGTPLTRTPTSTSTWGKSGPARESTPDIESKEDAIYDTVNALREQRMMMVMNEIQFNFLYEVVKEAFLEKYMNNGPAGTRIVDDERSSTHVAKKSDAAGAQDVMGKLKTQSPDEDTASEADTEIIDDGDEGGRDLGAKGKKTDPYAAVSPERVRQGEMEQD